MTMYTILTYLAVFRLEELGFPRFKEICSSQEPSKISTFVSYVFNKVELVLLCYVLESSSHDFFGIQENLWNTIRAAWMKVWDLEFVENKIIPRLEKCLAEMTRYAFDLDQNAVRNAAAEQAKQEAKDRGEAGLTKAPTKSPTRPQSPKLTKTRPPLMPEPERIDGTVRAKDVPAFINKTNLLEIQREKKDAAERIKKETTAKYNKSLEYKFHESKAGKPIDEVRREVEEERNKGLAFDSSYYNEPPDFHRNAPTVRLNAAAVLKEDALYRKQQAKDAETLRNYEEELRDPFEFYMWQKELRERDHADKLKGVALRREQAKQSAIEAREATLRQKEDNYSVASLMREQAEVIKQQKELEKEVEMLKHQEVVQSVIQERTVKPQEAMRRAVEARIEAGRKVRDELEEARVKKEEQDRLEEEIKADTIRQLRALNTVHKERIVVFDPTITAGIGLLDEMSYMEMQVRQKQERERAEEVEKAKRQQILEEKDKKALQLDKRVDVILRAREVKAQANQQARQKAKEAKAREEAALKEARAIAAAALDKELTAKREAHRAEQAALKAEQDRIKRQQQYLGAAMSQVEEMRERQLQMAKDRQAAALEREERIRMEGTVQAQTFDRLNKTIVEKSEKRSRFALNAERDLLVAAEKKVSIEKIKARIVEKKNMFLEGQEQHTLTKTKVVESNPYAEAISRESLAKARTARLNNSNFSAGRSSSAHKKVSIASM